MADAFEVLKITNAYPYNAFSQSSTPIIPTFASFFSLQIVYFVSGQSVNEMKSSFDKEITYLKDKKGM